MIYESNRIFKYVNINSTLENPDGFVLINTSYNEHIDKAIYIGLEITVYDEDFYADAIIIKKEGDGFWWAKLLEQFKEIRNDQFIKFEKLEDAYRGMS